MTPPSTRCTSRGLTLALLAFWLIEALALNGAMHLLAPPPYDETVLQHSAKVLRGEGGDDSWGAMQVALTHVRQAPEVPLYSQIFFTKQYRFQYPPSALAALAALQALAPDRVQINDFYAGPWPAINTLIGWLFIALTAVATATLLELGLRRSWPGTDWRPSMLLRGAIVAALTLTFYPIVKAFTLGQIQVWINALFALALLAWVLGHKASSAVLIGLASLIKPHYGLILVWAALRHETRFAVACAATIGIGLAASVAAFGLENHLDYVRVLSFLSQHGEAYYPNQSVNGLLNRLMSLGDPRAFIALDLPAGKFPPFTPWIYAATLVTSGALLIAALLFGRRGGHAAPDRTVELCIVALSCTLASPIAWEHHYGITLPIFGVLLASSIGDRRRLAWLALAYVLIATFMPLTNLLAGSVLNVFQSTLLAGALILLATLYRSAATASAAIRQTDQFGVTSLPGLHAYSARAPTDGFDIIPRT